MYSKKIIAIGKERKTYVKNLAICPTSEFGQIDPNMLDILPIRQIAVIGQ